MMLTAQINQMPRVRADAVTYRYPQNGHGLSSASLSACAGELLLVAGPSGCGKSTLARCLTGLIPHLYRGTLAGSVWLDGLRTTDVPLWQLAERAGLVFQNPAAQMLALSVEEEIIFGLENLGLARADIHERLDETLMRFDLASFRKRVPQTLSGGEQQKLALAAMTARKPPVLVLDEPLSMLDGTAAMELVAHLQELTRSGATVIVCEHREEYLRDLPGVRTVYLKGRTPPGDSMEPVLPAFDVHTAPFTLKIQNLSVRLGGNPILRDLSFSLESGTVVAVVGRNGVGKTTLLRALTGLQRYDGTVSADGERPDLGMVFQNADLQLFNATVREEILYRVPEPDRMRYAQVLGALGLAAYAEAPPLLLSEGEKKRVALAIVLMRGPRHGILLDEPALGQDAAHKAMLIRIARALAATGQLALLTTHDLTLAAQADRLLLLGPDGLVADGPPSALFRDPAPWQKIGLHVPPWVTVGMASRA